jgi:hypothetical protein
MTLAITVHGAAPKHQSGGKFIFRTFIDSDRLTASMVFDSPNGRDPLTSLSLGFQRHPFFDQFLGFDTSVHMT